MSSCVISLSAAIASYQLALQLREGLSGKSKDLPRIGVAKPKHQSMQFPLIYRFDPQLQSPARSVTGKLKKYCSPQLQSASCCPLISAQESARKAIHPARANARLPGHCLPC